MRVSARLSWSRSIRLNRSLVTDDMLVEGRVLCWCEKNFDSKEPVDVIPITICILDQSLTGYCLIMELNYMHFWSF